MGFLFGTSDGAKEQAAATREAAALQAKNDNLLAQASENSRETMVAQDKASKTAAELLSKPQGTVDVQTAPDGNVASVDGNGRRRTTRSTYTANTPTSGINI